MATEVLMPQMGESIAEGTITRWLVAVGETVERDQPLLEISTDKVDAEIPAPASGTLLQVFRQEGETVPVNEVVGMIGAEGESVGDDAGGETSDSAPVAEPEAAAATAVESPDTDGAMTLEERIRRFSSPLVRSIAAKEDVDIADVEGTGIHGRVTKKDILGYLEARERGEIPARPAAAPVAAPAVVAAPAPTAAAAPPRASRSAGGFHVPAYGPNENVRIEPMSKIREITAAHMAYSKSTSAHVTTVIHVDMTRVAKLRLKAKAGFQEAHGTKLTFMPFIFAAVAGALRKYPQLNAAIDGTNIVYKNDVNLGMAVAMDRGLIVPVLRHADRLNLAGLAQTANDLADRARTKKLMPDETQGGTFTITNPGVFGTLFGTPVINQPQVAILGIGTIEKRPVVLTDELGNDSLGIRTMSYFALTFDHRLIDGADADHFLNEIKRKLQDDQWGELSTFV